MAASSALSLSGRFSLTSATPPVIETVTRSLTNRCWHVRAVCYDSPSVAIVRARTATVALAVLIGVSAVAPNVEAQTEPDPTTTTAGPTTTTTTTVPVDDDPNVATVSTELADVPVDSYDLRATDAALAETLAGQTAARDARRAAEARIVELTAEAQRLDGVIAAETAHRTRAERAVESTRDELRDVAVARYIQGSTSDLLAVALNDLDRGTEAVGRAVVFAQISDDRIRAVLDALADRSAAEAALDTAVEDRADVEEDLADATADRDRAAADDDRLTAVVEDRQLDADRARALALVAGTDLPLVALDAYWRAQRAMAAERPACGLTWWALAGVGRSESNHGRFGLTLLEPDGETSAPIIGRRLDGTGSTRVIIDTDDGLLDGDTEFDRAVGPMQFLPGTWRRNGRDGNNDGVADPHNLYDATLGAAKLLCAGPMRSKPDMLAGFFRYNRSQAYAERVLARAYGYQLATETVPVLVAPLAVPPPPRPGAPTTTTSSTVPAG
jgi:membrane-bound lytic murein transglycosylase B